MKNSNFCNKIGTILRASCRFAMGRVCAVLLAGCAVIACLADDSIPDSKDATYSRGINSVAGPVFNIPSFKDKVDASAVDSAELKGTYIWIPDSLRDDIRRLLGGKFQVVRDGSIVDLGEKVTFRGDTINMVLKDRSPRILHRYDRKLYNFLYVPKGEWQLGLTASYGEFSTDNLQLFDILSDFTFKGKLFSVKPYLAYFLRDNMSVGVRFNYTNGSASLNSLSLDIDDDMGFDLHDVGYSMESYEASVFFRQYLGLSRKGRFGIFNEVSLGFSTGSTEFLRPYDGEMRSSRTSNLRASLNFSPGLTIFVMRNVSFNLSFGVFGFYLKNEKQTLNGEDLGNRFTSGADFRFNIFNINFGLGVHF